jgi:hypothetical protein
VQYLIPHKESTRGPKMATADVNNDGLNDFYVCGAKGQAGALYIQRADGSFQLSNQVLFEEYKNAEDVDAVFFDANNDKSPDLLVVSGGNEVLDESVEGLDRLYLNDGKGNFSLSKNPFPNQFESKSCVAVADVNKDGFTDFFIGNLAMQTAYGQPTTSFLYINNGDGHFTLSDRNVIYLQKTGMVTSAFFADLNNDSWPDLVIAGEWMPIKIFINEKGHFRETILPNSTGLWQCLYPTDLNGDDKTDFLAGNWGHNCKLWAGKNGPLKLYVKDFDNNNSLEQIMCYTIDGKQYTFLAKDELERSLPVLKKAYLTYSEVAGKTVQYMFYDLFKDYTELTAETLTSSAFINDGKGGFTTISLPEPLQISPIFSFTNKNPLQSGAGYLAVGNFYGVIPYEGRYDALYPSFFSYNKKQDRFSFDGIIPFASGEFRDAKWIKMANGNETLMLARNNSSILFFQPSVKK